MAKRFVDTSKYRKAWFRALPPRLKCAWDFLCLECDHAGIWNIDLESLKFHVGEAVTMDEITTHFDVHLVDDDKLFLPGFVDFQYGTLNPENRAHLSVINRLERLRIKGLARSLQGRKDKDKEQDKEKEKEETKNLDFGALYKNYPLKKGKSKGLQICRAQIKTQADYELLRQAIAKYQALVESEGSDPKFIKHFNTFMNCWRDYLDDDVGTSVVTNIDRSSICAIVRE